MEQAEPCAQLYVQSPPAHASWQLAPVAHPNVQPPPAQVAVQVLSEAQEN
jgi:hypothetical protein